MKILMFLFKINFYFMFLDCFNIFNIFSSKNNTLKNYHYHHFKNPAKSAKLIANLDIFLV